MNIITYSTRNYSEFSNCYLFIFEWLIYKNYKYFDFYKKSSNKLDGRFWTKGINLFKAFKANKRYYLSDLDIEKETYLIISRSVDYKILINNLKINTSFTNDDLSLISYNIYRISRVIWSCWSLKLIITNN